MFEEKAILIFVLLLMLSVSAAYASDENITDDIGIDGQNGNFTQLSNLIDNVSSNSTLSLDKDYKHESDSYYEGIEVNKSISIDGNGHAIEGTNNARIFQFRDANVHLKNIRFVNAFSNQSGGAICAYNCTLQIINCTFSFNQASDAGGAIYASSAKLDIADCTFLNNTCNGLYGDGGAVYAESSSRVNIIGSKFHCNSADSGGAVNSFTSNMTVENTEFADNIANWYGGSLFSDSIMNVSSSTFRNNRAGLKGGAIHSTYNGFNDYCSLFLSNSIFTNNSAIYGGAISSSNSNIGIADAGRNTIVNSRFDFNRATYGGVIARLSVSAIDMINSSCDNNSAINGTVIFAPAKGPITL